PPLPAGRRGRWRQRRWIPILRTDPIEPAIGEIREKQDTVRDGPRAAAILVHARACTEWRWNNIARLPIGSQAHHDVAACLLRPRFKPVDRIAVESRFR